MILNNKKQVISSVSAVIITVSSFWLSGCAPLRCIPLEQTQLNINSVEYSNAGSIFVCENSNMEFFVKDDTIIDNSSEVCIEAEDVEFIAATDEDIIYAVAANGGHELYDYNLENEESVLLTDEFRVLGMKGDERTVFIEVATEKGGAPILDGSAYTLLVFDGTNLYNPLEQAAITDFDNNYSQFTSNGYTYYIDNKLVMPNQIVYIESDKLQYSCLPYNVYFKEGDKITKIEREPLWLPEVYGYGGVSAGMTGYCDGRYYLIIQYSNSGTWGYIVNPVEVSISNELFCSYDGKTCETLYFANWGEQIAGFSIEKNQVYTIKEDGVYVIDLQTGDRKKKIKLPSVDKKVFCENQDDKMWIFVKSLHASEQFPDYVEIID